MLLAHWRLLTDLGAHSSGCILVVITIIIITIMMIMIMIMMKIIMR